MLSGLVMLFSSCSESTPEDSSNAIAPAGDLIAELETLNDSLFLNLKTTRIFGCPSLGIEHQVFKEDEALLIIAEDHIHQVPCFAIYQPEPATARINLSRYSTEGKLLNLNFIYQGKVIKAKVSNNPPDIEIGENCCISVEQE